MDLVSSWMTDFDFDIISLLDLGFQCLLAFMEPIYTLYDKHGISLKQECVPIIHDCTQTHAPYKDFCVLVLRDFGFGWCAGDVKCLRGCACAWCRGVLVLTGGGVLALTVLGVPVS